MAELIIGIVLDILGHVAIKNQKAVRVGRVPPSGSWRDAGCRISRCEIWLLGSSEFPVLLPEIAFEDFGRGQEPENCRIASGKASASVSRIRLGLWSSIVHWLAVRLRPPGLNLLKRSAVRLHDAHESRDLHLPKES